MLKHVFLAGGLTLLAACGDPLSGLDRIADVDLAAQDGTASALPTEAEVAREGFFGTPAAEGGNPASAEVTPDPETVATAPVRRKGLLGFLRRGGPTATPVADAEADAIAAAVAASEDEARPTDAPAEPEVALAALVPEAGSTSETEAKPAVRKGFFRRKPADAAAVPTGPDADDVAYGTQLPYGVIARSCASRGRPLGRKVEKADARKFALYDSNPRGEGARTWYLTGFSDGCPRQLTAANTLLGSASLYETLHYGPGGENLPKGETDKAYERIKRKVCGTRKGKPCGSKISQMDKSTFFVTAYQRFGNSSRWTEILVHDGAVVSVVVKPDG